VIAEVKAAVVRGDIFVHAFPHDGEASTFPDRDLFEAALNMAASGVLARPIL
jgi:predicted amidohydrolase